jgi:phage FluMu protein Com
VIPFKLHEFRKLTNARKEEVIRRFIKEESIYRCMKCGIFLFRGTLGAGTDIEIKCHDSRCKNMNLITQTN